jgi:site-specific recombinase XerD
MKLNDLVTHYVAFRRTLGERCRSTEALLRSFCRAVGPDTLVASLTVDAVAAYLSGRRPITSAWHSKYHALKGFFRFAVSRGHLDEAPLPTAVPKPAPPFLPYIYSKAELRRLLEAIATCVQGTRIDSFTLRTILLLLYGAGLRAREALSLAPADVDVANAVLTIRDTKFYKSRLVPIGRQLTAVLGDYARWRGATLAAPAAKDRFFIGQRGAAIHLWTLEKAFRRLRQHAGVGRSEDARYQPRLHDLRHTFAVHRLTAWYRQDADVQRLLHHLSVYLGHAHLGATAPSCRVGIGRNGGCRWRSRLRRPLAVVDQDRDAAVEAKVLHCQIGAAVAVEIP